MWLLQQLNPGSGAYNVPRVLRLHGPLDVEALRSALGALAARHEVLRSRCVGSDGGPVQVTDPPAPVDLAVRDPAGSAGPEREAEAQRLIAVEVRRAFDLGRDWPCRALLVRLAAAEHVLAITCHHIATDNWSRGILFRELAALYNAFSAGRPSPLPDLPVQYADFAVWQRQWLQGKELRRQLDYWRRHLAGAPAALALPTDDPRPAVQTYRGARQFHRLPAALTDRVKELSRREGATLFTTVLAAFAALLARYTGQEDIVIGTPVGGRSRAETEGLLGCFGNTLALRTDLSGDPTFQELLRRVRRSTLDAFDHQDLPFQRLVEELQPGRDPSRPPLFQVGLSVESAPANPPEFAGLVVEVVEADYSWSKVDFTLSVLDLPSGLRLMIEYRTDLFEEETIRRLRAHMEALLAGAAAEPACRLSGLPLLTESERHRLLVEWNDTATGGGPDGVGQAASLPPAGRLAACPAASSVHGLVEAQAARSPGAVAVVFGGDALTYADLDGRAGQLAAYLRRQGVGPGVLVGLHVERSLGMVVGLLGVLKAGGAYVPLDPAWPRQRLVWLIDDARLGCLLTQESLRGALPDHAARVVCLDRDWPTIAREAPGSPTSPPRQQGDSSLRDVAYVLYTSGSTGQPKGVAVCHGSVVNFLEAMRARPGLGPADTLLAVTTLAFDISALELLLPLTVGARVVIAPAAAVADGERLAALLAECGATVMQATPATWRMLLAAGWPGSPRLTALCGGEALTRDLADRLLGKCAALWNLYGPTETTVWSTAHRVEPGTRAVPIGRPIANTRVYVLDRRLQPLPVGVPGELHIGGRGVARGYLGRAALTADRFIPDPVAAEPGARLYRTGDLARWRPDGTVEWLGRLDSQVKVRGFRIELGEIEAALRGCPHVADAVAVTRPAADGEEQLVAYFVPREGNGVPAANLRGALRGRLPEHMIPAAFFALDRLPLTPNGKVDRNALPARAAGPGGHVAPTNPIEGRLCALWGELLGTERVGIDDNYFELGGHSLLAARLMGRVRDEFGVDVPLRALFENPTVRLLGREVEGRLVGAVGDDSLADILAEIEGGGPAARE
jgi:amino acid adenylation domain-containing protein